MPREVEEDEQLAARALPDALAGRDILGRASPSVVLSGLDIAIGRQTWPRATAIIADAPVFDLLDLADRPAAMIGPGFLKDDSLAIDFANGWLYIARRNR